MTGLAFVRSAARIRVPVSLTGLQWKLAIAALVTAVADRLFYDGGFGISVSIFLAVLALASFLANRSRAAWRRTSIAGAILFASLLPLLEHFGAISLLFGLAGTGLFSLVAAGRNAGNLQDNLLAVPSLFLAGPIQLTVDLIRARKLSRRAGRVLFHAGRFVIWIVPLCLGSVFLLLFVTANPLIEAWLAALDIWEFLHDLDYVRLAFWLVMTSLTWPFIRVRAQRMSETQSVFADFRIADPHPPGLDRVLGPAAILRSLVLFNLLFAVQTCLDVIYLWGGVALPDGMSHATYAHRGAYPLIATALLAAAFVLAAMRPGSETERAPLIRALVFLWVGQNVLLVVSSALRLDLYVAAYSLTYLRVAAFVWMGLVALGLVLIVARIALRRSNAWLIAMNAGALVLTLYVSAFVNFAHIIAAYNISHNSEISSYGLPLDKNYLVSLGPDAIPAIRDYIAQRRAAGYYVPMEFVDCLSDLIQEQRRSTADWRAWTFRGWRLSHYLEDHGGGSALTKSRCSYPYIR